MNKLWILGLALLLSGCLSDGTSNGDAETSSEHAPGETQVGEETAPFGGGAPGQPEPEGAEDPAEATEPHGTPTYERGDVEMSDTEATLTHTWANDVNGAQIGKFFGDASNFIVVGMHDEPGYKVQLTQSTTFIAAPELMFDQYDIDFFDQLEDGTLVLEPLYELKPDSPFACKPLPTGGNACVGSAPVFTELQVSLPKSLLFDLNLDTNLGDIVVEGFARSVDADANSGNVDITGNFEEVEAGANTGSVSFSGGATNLDLDSNSGRVEFHGDAETVDLGTNQGSIIADWTPIGEGTMDADANSGDVEITLPDVPARLELDTNLGDIEVDSRFVEVDEGVWETNGFESGVEVTADTNQGDITVQ